jgi:hypothetical protein
LLSKDEARSLAVNIAKLTSREVRVMLETPVIVVLVLLAIVAVLWWVYR